MLRDLAKSGSAVRRQRQSPPTAGQSRGTTLHQMMVMPLPCYMLMVGAETDVARLRVELVATGIDLDIRVQPDYRTLFPATDAVLCVTLNGCSCACVAAFGLVSQRKVVEPAYAFRGAVAQAVLKFRKVRLLAMHSPRHGNGTPEIGQRTTSLLQLLGAVRLEPWQMLTVVG